jgi:hypothetical protein
MELSRRIRILAERYLIRPKRIAANAAMGRSKIKCFKTNEWSIGIYKGTSPLDLCDPADIENPVLTAANVTDVKADFVADPFMIQKHSVWYMFFEVMHSLRGKGEIGLATSQDCRQWNYQSIVLRESFHLSYPMVFKWENEYLMVPESGEANRIGLYKAKNFPYDWEYVMPLIEGKVWDHALFKYQDTWWLFAGTAEPLLSNKLQLFYADDLFGPWKEHPESPLISDDARIARPGGGALLVDNKPVRLAQNCLPSYGNSLNAFCISTLSKTDYREHAFARNPILSPGRSAWTLHGMHHMDAHELREGEWVACVDGYTRKVMLQVNY